MKIPFKKNLNNVDWERYLVNEFTTATRKQHLLDECNKNDISIYIDNENEISNGVYSTMRGVASESELERRLITKKTYMQARASKKIAILAIVISAASFLLALYPFLLLFQ